MRVSGHPWNLPKQTNKGRIIHFESYQCVSKLREYRSAWISFQLANERKTLESFKCRSGPISSKTKKGAKVSTSSQHWKKKTDPMAPLIHQSQKLLDGIPSLDPMRRQPVVKFIAKVQGVVAPAWDPTGSYKR